MAIKKEKQKRMIRVPTNIPYFDEFIEGGFEKNTTNLVVGGSGSGKTVFATQFLVGGMRKGEHCLYVTFEEKREQFYTNMLEFGWDLEKYEKEGVFTFLEYTPGKVKTMLEEGGGAIENIIIKQKVTRMVIDSITAFAELFDEKATQREAALSLFGTIRDWNCTSLLTFEEVPIQGTKVAPKPLEFESDSIIVLYYKRIGNERQRFIEILKMRGTNHSKKLYHFTIENEKGIVIDPNPVSLSKNKG